MIYYDVVETPDQLQPIAREIDVAGVVALDLETVGKDPRLGEIRLVQVRTDAGKRTYVIDLFKTKTLGPVLTALKTSQSVKVLQNAKFDQKWLLFKFGLELKPVFDTYRASAILYNGKDLAHDFYSLLSRELGQSPPTDDMQMSDWGGTLENRHYEYAASDVQYLHELRTCLKTKVLKGGLAKIAAIEFGAILPEASIELNGFALDKDLWLVLAAENEKKAEELRKVLVMELPPPSSQMTFPGMEPKFNLNSPQQMLTSLRKMGLDVDSTSEMTLAAHAGKFPVIRRLLQYRGYSKNVSSFGPEYLKHLHPVTGRIHTDFFPFTEAGRYSSRHPNLQHIPRDKAFRRCFRAPIGKKLVVADYSQIELRIAAEISGDKRLIEVYRKGEDAHRVTASIIANVPLEAVTSEQRQQAKPVNFGLIYSLGADKLVLYAQANYGVSLTQSMAEKFIERYFEGYSGIKEWQIETLGRGKKTGISRTKAGRLRYLNPEESHGEFLNTPVQGLGADGLKASLSKVYERIRPYKDRVRMVHMVHDEIILEADDDPELLERASKDLKEGMVEGIAPFLERVPVVVEGGVGQSWADK